MSLPISIPGDPDLILPAIQEIVRRAVDGTILPIFVDYSNQRVIIGATAASASPAKVEVTGDVKILNGDLIVDSSSKGIILEDAGGSGRQCRVRAFYDSDSGNWYFDPIDA